MDILIHPWKLLDFHRQTSNEGIRKHPQIVIAHSKMFSWRERQCHRCQPRRRKKRQSQCPYYCTRKPGRGYAFWDYEERFRDQEQPIVQCWVFDITGRPSDELKHILRKLQANDPGGAKRRRILTYLTKVRTLCARADGAPAIHGPIKESLVGR